MSKGCFSIENRSWIGYAGIYGHLSKDALPRDGLISCPDLPRSVLADLGTRLDTNCSVFGGKIMTPEVQTQLVLMAEK